MVYAEARSYDPDWESTLVDWPLKAKEKREYLRGVVDMGSNGIRFSISDLTPPTTRILPTIYVYRVDIGLFDAQFDPDTNKRTPIPLKIMEAVGAALFRFQVVCKDFGVPDDQIRVLATEATRTAINCAKFLEYIKAYTGLHVEILPKEVEGRIGALGVASGFCDMQGITMDLGGGSTQITWLIAEAGNIRISPKGSFSFPYGAAALTMKLEELQEGKSKKDAEQAVAAYREEMKENFIKAANEMQIPQELVGKARKEGGYHLYLSGGGFRGWGYLLLYINQVHGNHYPISVINGFSAKKSEFEDTRMLKEVAQTADLIFRISDRRRRQVPAVAFLINTLAEAFPHGIKEVYFCEGGVREGLLFQELSPSIRKQDPLEVATARFAPPSADSLYNLLISSIPKASSNGLRRIPETISAHLLKSFINVMYAHGSMPKESSSMAALYSTGTSIMASTHGVSHTDRARLALMLEQRYAGELPPREFDFMKALAGLLAKEEVWWTRYLAKVAFLMSRLYPAGTVDERKPRVVMSADWDDHLGTKKNKRGISLTISIQRVENDPMKLKEALEEHINVIVKVGKKKNWIGGNDGFGMAVEVKVLEEDIL